jgi:hypothetical protein
MLAPASGNAYREAPLSTFAQLAQKILDPKASPQTAADLTACLSYGNGAMRIGNTNRGLIVLQPIAGAMQPNAPGFLPVLVGFRIPDELPLRRIGDSSFVGKSFCRFARYGFGSARPNGYHEAWAPAAINSYAPVPIAGPLNAPVGTTPDLNLSDNVYEWRDVRAVPVGGVVYRITSSGVVIAFQRLGDGQEDSWVQVECGARRDFGNVYQVVKAHPQEPATQGLPSRLPLAFDPAAIRRRIAKKA